MKTPAGLDHETYDALLEALKAQRFISGDKCFCEVSIDNPMLRGEHTHACRLAVAAITKAEEVKS